MESSPVVPVVPVVYWRPGCPFCAVLRFRLRRLGITTKEVNIWEDPSGAAAVRAITGGDETVPTVVVGDQSRVNPSAAEVRALVDQVASAGPA